MRLATFTAPGAESEPLAGVLRDGVLQSFAYGTDAVRQVLAGELSVDAELAANPELGRYAVEDVTLLAPISHPGTVYAVGLNYSDHIAEMGHEFPSQPMLFTKRGGSVAPPSGPVRRPAIVSRLDYEAELALVIGSGGRLAGLTIADDISARDLQSEPNWVRAKGADTFCPYGPWITTLDDAGDPQQLWIKSWVNGELRQDSNTSNLVFGPQALMDYIGTVAALTPGDLILTGTPGGVGQGMKPPQYLQPGDRVRIEIESLGVIEHTIVDAD